MTHNSTCGCPNCFHINYPSRINPHNNNIISHSKNNDFDLEVINSSELDKSKYINDTLTIILEKRPSWAKYFTITPSGCVEYFSLKPIYVSAAEVFRGPYGDRGMQMKANLFDPMVVKIDKQN